MRVAGRPASSAHQVSAVHASAANSSVSSSASRGMSRQVTSRSAAHPRADFVETDGAASGRRR